MSFDLDHAAHAGWVLVCRSRERDRDRDVAPGGGKYMAVGKQPAGTLKSALKK